MVSCIAARLTGAAARFVYLLQDYGHLDEAGVDRLLLAVADVVGSEDEPVADLAVVRRLAATMLFDRLDAEGQDADLLQDDWPLLFH